MKNKLGKTRKPPMSVITSKAVEQFRKICNHGEDSKREAELKIERDYMLGRVVDISYEDNGICIVQYYDIFMRVNNTIVTSVFRDKNLARSFNDEFGQFEKNKKKYDKFNKRYRL